MKRKDTNPIAPKPLESFMLKLKKLFPVKIRLIISIDLSKVSHLKKTHERQTRRNVNTPLII